MNWRERIEVNPEVLAGKRSTRNPVGSRAYSRTFGRRQARKRIALELPPTDTGRSARVSCVRQLSCARIQSISPLCVDATSCRRESPSTGCRIPARNQHDVLWAGNDFPSSSDKEVLERADTEGRIVCPPELGRTAPVFASPIRPSYGHAYFGAGNETAGNLPKQSRNEAGGESFQPKRRNLRQPVGCCRIVGLR